MEQIEIYVVEDQTETAFWLQSQLEAFGYHVPCTTWSGEQAIRRIEEQIHKPDLILMDINFEEGMEDSRKSIDGIDAARILHEKHGIPIIYLTGSTDTATIARASKSGAFGYLVKPINPTELKTTIELTISKNRRLEDDKKKELERAKSFIEGQDKERIRFSEELHEEIGTVLSAISSKLSYLEEVKDFSKDNIVPEINRIRAELNEVIHSVRLISSELVPSTLINLGLKQGILNYLKMLKEKNPSIYWEVNLDDLELIQHKLNMGFKVSLYRILVELMNNVYQHSKARNAGLECIVSKSGFDLIVEDDGIGFDTFEIEQTSGIGYRSVNSRISILNGVLHIDTDATSKRGTYICMHFPLINREFN